MRRKHFNRMFAGITFAILATAVAAFLTSVAWTGDSSSGSIGEKTDGKQDAPLGANPKLPIENWPLFRGGPLAQGVSATKLPVKLTLLWKKSYQADDEGFDATAIIDNGTVYLGGLNGPFYALDLETGNEKWRIPSEVGFQASASIRKGLLYLGDLDGKFHCFDAATGKRKWVFAAQAQIDNGANFYKDRVIFGSQDATLYCLDAAGGKLVWKHAIADQIRCFPTIVANRGFVAGCDSQLYIIDLDQGKRIDGVPLEGPTACSPAIFGDMAYVGTEGPKFYAINWRTAKEVWTYEHPQRKFSYRASAAVTKDVIVAANRGKFLVGLDPASGKQKWIYYTRSGIDSSPVIVADRAFVGTDRGLLFAVNIKTGKLAWQYETGGGFQASPAVADGRLVIASDDGVVYCFGKK